MKSEFMLAFNEICESRGLTQDVVIEALKTALVSAYRRNTNVSNIQEVAVDIDQRSGEPTIFAEKEVVDSLFDGRTEVLLNIAHKSGHPDAELGDMVMMDSTPENFGRIAAQTAKQVILQRVREAEREKLFEDFSAREGEIVNGTVQSVSGQNVTIGLGRTEAILPKSQRVNRERYRAHDKIRVYVLEVRRTNRGPQIIVSRNHRSLLRRLLELEVPEIYNGQVDIKSIAREAGARSKVAVMAMQPGIDPVGACVGMRGVRIQSIVRELNDEKIDVIEWDPDQRTFIAKALSPARVARVFLEDHPDKGKTAIVIVPDDQLSLAIGREGQNARLAAKLTGWRIDIKSLTEAAVESLSNIDDPAADPAVAKNQELIAQVELILAKKEASRPITSEDYMILGRLIAGVEGSIVAVHAAEYEQIQKARSEARSDVPDIAWSIPLEELQLSTRVEALLIQNHIATVGAVILRMVMGEEALLDLPGFGQKALDEVKEAVANYALPEPSADLEDEALVVAKDSQKIHVEVEATSVTSPEEVATAQEIEPSIEGEIETAAEKVEEIGAHETVTTEEVEPEAIEEEEEASIEVDIDDLAVSLVQPEKPKKVTKRKHVVVVKPTDETVSVEEDDKRKQMGKELVYDEKLGKVVVKRKHKGSRDRPSWEEYADLDVEEVFDDVEEVFDEDS